MAKIAIPPATSRTTIAASSDLERDLKNVVFRSGQGLEALPARSRWRAPGLGKGDKPIGAFLFSGPTGCGKTEAAKQLAYIMGIDRSAST